MNRRYEYFDSIGNMTGYELYNNMTKQYEYYSTVSQQRKPNRYREPEKLDLRISTYNNSRQRQYNEAVAEGNKQIMEAEVNHKDFQNLYDTTYDFINNKIKLIQGAKLNSNTCLLCSHYIDELNINLDDLNRIVANKNDSNIVFDNKQYNQYSSKLKSVKESSNVISNSYLNLVDNFKSKPNRTLLNGVFSSNEIIEYKRLGNDYKEVNKIIGLSNILFKNDNGISELLFKRHDKSDANIVMIFFSDSDNLKNMDSFVSSYNQLIIFDKTTNDLVWKFNDDGSIKSDFDNLIIWKNIQKSKVPNK